MQYNTLAAELANLTLSGPDWPEDGFQFPKKLEEALEVENPAKIKNSLENEM